MAARSVSMTEGEMLEMYTQRILDATKTLSADAESALRERAASVLYEVLLDERKRFLTVTQKHRLRKKIIHEVETKMTNAEREFKRIKRKYRYT